MCDTHCWELILSTSALKDWTRSVCARECNLLIIYFIFLDTSVNHTVYLNMLQMWFLVTSARDSSQSNDKPENNMVHHHMTLSRERNVLATDSMDDVLDTDKA